MKDCSGRLLGINESSNQNKCTMFIPFNHLVTLFDTSICWLSSTYSTQPYPHKQKPPREYFVNFFVVVRSLLLITESLNTAVCVQHYLS